MGGLTSPPVVPPSYRPDVDGLRAVAVLSVVGFHTFPGWIHGGFVGVDVFFVISGFLITGIIVAGLQKGTFSYLDFYARRVRRIFPALMLLLAASLVAGAVLMMTDEKRQLAKHVLAASAFVANFAFWGEIGYFDKSAGTKPLLHLWSLGIEEQFYLAWPFVVATAWKRRYDILALILLVGGASFLYNVVATSADPPVAFYWPLPRFWELMAGGLIACAATHRPDVLRRMPGLASVVGIALISLSVVLVRDNWAFPGFWVLLPTAGAFLVIAAGRDAWVNRVVLSRPLVVGVGLISYPLYLWHWALLCFARLYYTGENLGRMPRIVLVSVAFLLAWLTYELIERPIRRSRKLSVAGVLVAVAAFMAIASFALYWYQDAEIASGRAPDIEFVKARTDWAYPEATFDGTRIRATVLRGASADAVLFVGDSHMAHYFPAARALYAQGGALPHFTAIYAAHSDCTPSPATRIRSMDAENRSFMCDRFFDVALRMAMRSEVKVVVFGGNWEIREGSNYDAESLRAFGESMRQLVLAGKRVIVILNSPQSLEFHPEYLNRHLDAAQKRGSLAVDARIPRQVTDPRMADLASVAERAGATTIDPYEFLCSGSSCPVLENGRPVHRDAGHLRPFFAIERARFIERILRSGQELSAR